MAEIKTSDVMPFGKYKGMIVGRMCAEDPSYACWLRDEQRRADPRSLTFDYDLNHGIDGLIDRSPALAKKFKKWDLPSPSVAIAAAAALKVEAAKQVAYADGWASW